MFILLSLENAVRGWLSYDSPLVSRMFGWKNEVNVIETDSNVVVFDKPQEPAEPPSSPASKPLRAANSGSDPKGVHETQ